MKKLFNLFNNIVICDEKTIYNLLLLYLYLLYYLPLCDYRIIQFTN